MPNDRPTTTISVQLGDLGSLGLTFAADVLEANADTLATAPFHAESLQMVVDMLRQIAVQAGEASRAK